MITEACIGTKDQSCVEVCPVACIYDAGDQFLINPEECIDCGACEPECPVEAIYPEDEVPEEMESYMPRPPGSTSQRPSRARAGIAARRVVDSCESGEVSCEGEESEQVRVEVGRARRRAGGAASRGADDGTHPVLLWSCVTEGRGSGTRSASSTSAS